MAVPRDNMFGLFAGAPGAGGRQQQRRQFALGPSQIANLPGNFPMPRTSPGIPVSGRITNRTGVVARFGTSRFKIRNTAVILLFLESQPKH